jgi:hypothetical protein
MDEFTFNREMALADINDPNGFLWPINAYSDADELNALLEEAVRAGAIACRKPKAALYAYPLPISAPDPVLVVDRGEGPMLLGHTLGIREREGEDPIEFTLRLLQEATAEANAVVAEARNVGWR